MPLIALALFLAVVAAVMFFGAGAASGLQRRQTRLASIGVAVVAVGMTLASVIRQVDAGTVQVETRFGRVTENVLSPGLHLFVHPLSVWHTMNTRVATFNFTDYSSATAISADGVQLDIDTQFSFRLNPDYAWRVFDVIGNERAYFDTVSSAAREAVRDGVAQFDWTSAATTRRRELGVHMRDEFERKLIEKLLGARFTEEQARGAFTIAAVDLRRVEPPQIVIDANSQEAAALEELERQETLTQIAEEQANRRAQEGAGVSALFTELPDNYTSAEIAGLLHALADRERADALTRAVESGRVTVIVMDGGAGGASLATSAAAAAR